MNIEQLIADANPVPAAGLPSAGSLRARRILSEVLTDTGGRSRLGKPGSRRRLLAIRPRTALILAAGCAAAAIVVTQVLPGAAPGPRARPPGHPGTAPTALRELALVAAGQPAGPALRRGEFQYTESKSLNWSDTYISARIHYSVSYRQHRQVWIALNGSGRIKETNVDPRFASPRDRAAWIKAGRPSLRTPPWDQRFGPHGLSLGPVNLRKLPTDPARLRALLFARKIEGGPPGPGEDFIQVGDLLRETDAAPALRAALFKIVATIPGVRVLGTVRDQAGRPGIGVAYFDKIRAGHGHPAQVSESVLIFDRQSSKLLGEQTWLTDTTRGKRSLAAWTVYLVSTVVKSDRSAPAARAAGGTGGPAERSGGGRARASARAGRGPPPSTRPSPRS